MKRRYKLNNKMCLNILTVAVIMLCLELIAHYGIHYRKIVCTQQSTIVKYIIDNIDTVDYSNIEYNEIIQELPTSTKNDILSDVKIKDVDDLNKIYSISKILEKSFNVMEIGIRIAVWAIFIGTVSYLLVNKDDIIEVAN